MKKLVMLAFALMLMLLLAACGDNNSRSRQNEFTGTRVPNVMGMNYSDATRVLEGIGLEVVAVEADASTILSQSRHNRTVLRGQVFRVNDSTDPNYRDTNTFSGMAPDGRVIITYAIADYIFEDMPNQERLENGDGSDFVSRTYSLDANATFRNLSFKVDETWLLAPDEYGDIYYFEDGSRDNDKGFLIFGYMEGMGVYTLSEAHLEVIKEIISSRSVANNAYFFGEPEKIEVAGRDAWLFLSEGVLLDSSKYMEDLYFIDDEQTLHMIGINVPFDRKDEYKGLLREFATTINIASATTPPTPTPDVGSVDWRAFLREYEEWVDEYIDLMRRYAANPTDLSLLIEYMESVQRIIEWAERAERVEVDLANDPVALAEFLATMVRIIQRLAEAHN